MKRAMVLLVFLLNVSVLNAQSKIKTLDSSIVHWTTDYYFKKNHITKDIKDVHVFLIEKQVVQSQYTALYTIGINRSGMKDMILFYRSINGVENFTVIGESDLKTNLKELYQLFEKYRSFSAKAKVICYERFIIDSEVRMEKGSNKTP